MSDYVCRRCHKAKRIFEFPEDSTDFTVCVECMRESYLEELKPRHPVDFPVGYTGPPSGHRATDPVVPVQRTPEPPLVADLKRLGFVDPFLKNGKYAISGEIRCRRDERRQVTRSLNEAIKWLGHTDRSSEFAWWPKQEQPDQWVYYIQRIRKSQS